MATKKEKLEKKVLSNVRELTAEGFSLYAMQLPQPEWFALTRLEAKGLVTHNGKGWVVTDKGMTAWCSNA